MARTAILSARAAAAYPERDSDADDQPRPARIPPAGRDARLLRQIDEQANGLAEASQQQLRSIAQELRGTLAGGRLETHNAMRAFALVREMSQRVLDRRHYDVQMLGGWVLLNGGLAEMETGEGKTLTATLPACAAALAGMPVHVVTVNDYLAARDAEEMGPLYAALGITTGLVTAASTPAQRRAAYRADVTYCTGKQVAFDYLRDRLTLGSERGNLRLRLEKLYSDTPRIDRVLLRGLHFAIVDEADSILIDEARTPLLISRPGEARDMREACTWAMDLAGRLEPELHFRIDSKQRSVTLTEVGKECLRVAEESAVGPRGGPARRAGLLHTAVLALHAYAEGRDYLVRDGKVAIIDANTGRVMPDRNWGRELHPMIEWKEGCELSLATETMARISFQTFFSRYLHLSGMTGTAREVATELRSVYGLPVRSIATHRPAQRRDFGWRLYADCGARNAALVLRLRSLRDAGRPVLIGTRSVSESQALAEELEAAGLPYNRLDAHHDRAEAEVVAAAGQAGCITVATNMAGRGTDIALGPGVAAAGGLHVIATSLNEAARIDRQLAGRCARQGDPGSCETWITLEDELLRAFWPAFALNFAARVAGSKRSLPGRLARFIVKPARVSILRLHRSMRQQVRARDRELGHMLAFSGDAE